ncbi:MAG: mechanosensitive ion channel [Alphaproteobacteria bacterium]|nr:mechanosensitive ion channel [Alphaproteobacteria bacterium]
MIRWLLLLVFVAFGGLSPLQAQTPPVAPDTRELERVLALLEDEGQRTAFAQQLRAVLEAARATGPATPEPPTPVGLLGGMLASLTDTLGAISEGLSGATAAVSNVPGLWAWVEQQVRDPNRAAWWATLAWKLTAILIAGWIGDRSVKLALRPLLLRLAGVTPSGTAVRLGLVAVRMVIGLARVAGFAAGSYLTIAVVEPSLTTRLVALALVNGALIVHTVVVLLDAVLQPRVARLRLVKLDDHAAAYLYVWLRRLASIAIYGAFLIQAAQLLGLGIASFLVLQRLLGLTIAVMLAMLVLQNRAVVATWIKGATAWPERTKPPRVRLAAHRLAEFWHIITLGYIAVLFVIWATGVPGGFLYVLRVTVLTGVVFAAAAAATNAINWVIERGFSVGQDLHERLPDLQSRANRYLPLLKVALRGFLWVIAGIVLLQVWGVSSFAWLGSPTGRRVVGSVVTISLVIGVALAAWEVISATIERFLTEVDAEGRPIPRSGRLRTLLPLLRNAALVVLVVVSTLIVLSELGVNIAPLLAGAGVIGLAIGFGAQTLVRDVITGLFILFEDTIRVGDVVTAAGKSGTVEAINIRGIRLRDAAGNLISIPFGSVGDVTNMTRDFAYASFDIPIEIGRDLETARATLASIDADLRQDPVISAWLLGPLEVLGIERFDGGLFFLRARIKTVPGKQWSVAREVNLRLQAGFIDKGVWVPAVPPVGSLPAPTGTAD